MPSRRIEIPIGKRESKAESAFVSSQSLVNCFWEAIPDGIEAAYGGPGLTQFAEVGDGPIRGEYVFGDTLYAVSGSMLYSVDTNGDETALGAVAGYDPVIISDNGFTMAIVSDSTSYLYDTTSGLVPINDTDFRRASSVDFLRQVFIFTEANSGRYFTSELADGTSYVATDVATAEIKPDNVLRVFVSGDEGLLFGTKSVEGVYFSGKPDGVPLSPTQTNLDYGLIGRDAVCAIDNTVAWVSNKRDIRTLRGGSPIAIADPTIITAIQNWTNPASIRAFSFAIRGHEWMALRHDEGCYIWDATTQMWSARKSYGQETWRVNSAIDFDNKIIMGDASEGILWQLDPAAHAEGSNPLVRECVTSTLGPGGSPFTLDGVELEVEVGVGLATGQGVAPKIWMQLSRDSGRTFGVRMERSLGAMGNRAVRVMWTGPFGDFRPEGGVIKWGCSDTVKLTMKRGWADITVNKT